MITLKVLKDAIAGILWVELPEYVKGNTTLNEVGARCNISFAQWLSDYDVLLYVPKGEAAQKAQIVEMAKCVTLDDLLAWINAENAKVPKKDKPA